jgi:hypothetical protein
MDIREHSIALVSVIVGMGLTDLFGNLNRLIRARRTIRWDALPIAWAAIALILVNNFWWALYLGVTGIEKPSSAGTFLLSLSTPALLYLICAAALPYGRTAKGLDLREAYLAESRYFFILIVIYVLMTQFLVLLTGAAFQWNEATVLRGVFTAVCIPLIWTRRIAYHWMATIVVLAITFFRLFQLSLH